MNILFVTPYLPSYIRTRSYNFIKSLVKRGHNIHLVALKQVPSELDGTKQLFEIGVSVDIIPLPTWRPYFNCCLNFFSANPLQCSFCSSDLMKSTISRILYKEKVDIVHAEHIRAIQYIDCDSEKTKIVFDAVDCMTNLYEQFAKRQTTIPKKIINFLEWKKFQKYEPVSLKKFNNTVVTSNIDKKILQQASVNSKISVVGNGVDFDFFSPNISVKPDIDLIFTGKMSYFANEESILNFKKNVLPIIWSKFPLINLYIIGNSPSERIKRLCRDPRITITGFVKDLRPYFNRAKIAIAPIVVGAGIQNKVLEAMAMAKPIVATPIACQSLKVTHGREVLISNNPEKFAAFVLRLLNNQEILRGLGQNGRNYVLKYHNWARKVDQLEKIYLSSVKARQS